MFRQNPNIYSKCHKYVPIESVSVTICRKPPNDFV
jgi:hypothetical protein